MKKFLPLFVLLLTALVSDAQEKCTAATIQAAKLSNDPALAARRQAIEQYTRDWIAQHPDGIASRSLLTIPVVVHVVHAGEAIGTGGNISDAQVLSQIDVLNLDYKNLNTDSMQSTHPFYPLVGNAGIQFCMASVDTAGNPTTGIDRIDGNARFGMTTWPSATVIDATLKPATIWAPTRYLNLWVTTFSAGGEDSSTLGYATFPENHGTNTDGVVIKSNAFGTTGSVSGANAGGRTGTHEVGHYLNLRHVWGDQNCGDDSVADTPPQVTKNYGCPTFPHNANNACGAGLNGEMYMNYMDYVDDPCMIMFSKGQAGRIQAALSGPRQSLLASTACGTVGIHDISYVSRVSVYPNPASGSINVSVNVPLQNASIEIFNALGQKMMARDFVGSAQLMNLNVSSFDAGLYSLVVTSEHQKYFAKVILTK
jgi:hypothetical protein